MGHQSVVWARSVLSPRSPALMNIRDGEEGSSVGEWKFFELPVRVNPAQRDVRREIKSGIASRGREAGGEDGRKEALRKKRFVGGERPRNSTARSEVVAFETFFQRDVGLSGLDQVGKPVLIQNPFRDLMSGRHDFFGGKRPGSDVSDRFASQISSGVWE